MKRALLLALLLVGCHDDGGGVDASVASDLGIGDLGTVGPGTPTLRAAFTVSGCATLVTPTTGLRCSGHSPLTLTFVPLGEGVTTFVWTFAGGSPATSRATSPTVTFATAGTYTVSLAAGGLAGTTTTTGTVVVTSGATGSACLADTDCDASAGLSCICKPGEGGCSGALAVGFCSRLCSGGMCATGEICADFTRGGAFVPASADGGNDGTPSTEVWRQALCLPGCNQTSDCPSGPTCRELPALAKGGVAGGVYTWQRGCFVDIGGDDGDSCLSPSGGPDAAQCLSGRCEALGSRGLCTSSCATSSDCPSTAACATFNAAPAPASAACLVRCGGTTSCTDPLTADPLLGWQPTSSTGELSFKVTPAEPTASFWAPRRCDAKKDPPDCPVASSTCSSVGASGVTYCIPR